MGSSLKLAVVGAGRMGAFHVRTLAAAPGIDIVAVVDARPDVAAEVAAKAGASPLGSVSELAVGDVDAWLIATPTPTHPELVMAALEATAHVLCEKPLALDPVEGHALDGAAAAAGRILQVGFWRRFSPPWAVAKKQIEAGAIGQPLLVRLAQWDANPPPPGFCDPAVSGGLAIDCGVHEYDLAEWLTGARVEGVSARNLPLVDRSVGDAGDVDNLVARLDLTGGLAATVDLSRNSRYGDDVRTEILGSEGALFIDLLPTGRTRLATASGVQIIPDSVVADVAAAGVVGQALAFAAAIEGRANDLPGAAASNRAVLIGRAVQKAAATGSMVLI